MKDRTQVVETSTGVLLKIPSFHYYSVKIYQYILILSRFIFLDLLANKGEATIKMHLAMFNKRVRKTLDNTIALSNSEQPSS